MLVMTNYEIQGTIKIEITYIGFLKKTKKTIDTINFDDKHSLGICYSRYGTLGPMERDVKIEQSQLLIEACKKVIDWYWLDIKRILDIRILEDNTSIKYQKKPCHDYPIEWLYENVTAKQYQQILQEASS